MQAALDALRPARRRREQRRLRARPHVRPLRRGRVGRGDARAPEGPLLRRAPRAASTGATSRRPGAPVDARIINTSSGAGLQGSVGQSAYSAAKAGIAALTLVQAAELGALRRHRQRDRALGAHAHDREALRRHDEGARERLRRDGLRRTSRRSSCGSAAPSRATSPGSVFEVAGGKISVADGWRTGPRVDKGARWERRRGRRRRARPAREGGAAAEGVRDLTVQLRVHRGAGGAARHGARLPRRALVVRAACAPRWRASAASTPTVWKRIGAELGWTAVAIPEAYGGLGLGAVELVALHGGDGRGAPLRAVLLDRRASPRSALLEARRARRSRPSGSRRIAAGERPRRSRSPRPTALGADGVERGARGGRRLRARRRGARTCVDGHSADLLVVARGAGATARRRQPLRACPATPPGLERRALPTLDHTRRLAELALRRRARAGDARGSAREGAARPGARAQRSTSRAIALAAEQVGGAQRCLDLAVAYAKERVQFGRPIGSFQAIKHKCADMMVRVESARSAAYWAGCVAAEPAARDLLRASPRSRRRAAPTPYFHCAAERAPDPRRRRLHLGVRRPSLLQARARRARRFLGDAAWHRERVARRIGLCDDRRSTSTGKVVHRDGRRARRRPRHQPSASSPPAREVVDLRAQASPSRCPRAGGRRATFVAADVREPEQIDRARRRDARALRPPRRARRTTPAARRPPTPPPPRRASPRRSSR